MATDRQPLMSSNPALFFGVLTLVVAFVVVAFVVAALAVATLAGADLGLPARGFLAASLGRLVMVVATLSSSWCQPLPPALSWPWSPRPSLDRGE